jgi:hypothetical protein
VSPPSRHDGKRSSFRKAVFVVFRIRDVRQRDYECQSNPTVSIDRDHSACAIELKEKQQWTKLPLHKTPINLIGVVQRVHWPVTSNCERIRLHWIDAAPAGRVVTSTLFGNVDLCVGHRNRYGSRSIVTECLVLLVHWDEITQLEAAHVMKRFQPNNKWLVASTQTRTVSNSSITSSPGSKGTSDRFVVAYKLNLTLWPESASELYRPSDSRLSAKLVPTFADRGHHVASV